MGILITIADALIGALLCNCLLEKMDYEVTFFDDELCIFCTNNINECECQD